MFCSNCGKQMNDEDKFCSSCGKTTAVLVDAELVGASPQPPAGQQIHQSQAAHRPAVPVAQVPDYMVFSVVITVLGFLCCCCSNPITPALGIVGVILSTQSRRKLSEGNISGAEADANTAKILCWIGLTLYILVFVLGIVSHMMGVQFVDPRVIQEFQEQFRHRI